MLTGGMFRFFRADGTERRICGCGRGRNFVAGLRHAAAGQTPSVSSKAKSVSSGSQGAAGKKLSISRSGYVSDEACARCHQDKGDSYDKTAHHITSQVADKNTIVGTFGPGAHTIQTANPNLTFRMDSKGDEFFQTAIWGTPPNERTHTQRLDLVIGLGGKGRTYLIWDDNQLFQLPVGYSTVLGQWINSPGYKDGTASFDRGKTRTSSLVLDIWLPLCYSLLCYRKC